MPIPMAPKAPPIIGAKPNCWFTSMSSQQRARWVALLWQKRGSLCLVLPSIISSQILVHYKAFQSFHNLYRGLDVEMKQRRGYGS